MFRGHRIEKLFQFFHRIHDGVLVQHQYTKKNSGKFWILQSAYAILIVEQVNRTEKEG